MKRAHLLFGLIIALLTSCNSQSYHNQNPSQVALGNMTDQDLEPYYEQVYYPDAVQLEEAGSNNIVGYIDDWAAIKLLANSSKEIKADYLNFILSEYKTITPKNADRFSYSEAGHLGHYIVWKYKRNETADFDAIFKNAELALNNGTESAQNLVVVGFFEGIQNIGGWHKVDYHKGFDNWLGQNSKIAWDDLIVFWEGKSPQ